MREVTGGLKNFQWKDLTIKISLVYDGLRFDIHRVFQFSSFYKEGGGDLNDKGRIGGYYEEGGKYF